MNKAKLDLFLTKCEPDCLEIDQYIEYMNRKMFILDFIDNDRCKLEDCKTGIQLNAFCDDIKPWGVK